MTWTNRVVWQEGMFLRAQHFQQQDRWLEQLVRGARRGVAPASLGRDRDGDRPRPARHRPLRAGIGYRRVRGRHAVRDPRARPTIRRRSTCRTARATRVVYLAAADPPGGRGRGRPTATAARAATRCATSRPTTRIPARRSPRRCRSAGCACATCWRPRSAPAIMCIGLARDRRGHRRPARHARRTMDPAGACLLRRAAAVRPDRRVRPAC